MSSDYAACAELCERHGFDRPAELLREVGRGQARVFLAHPGAFFHNLDQVRSLLASPWYQSRAGSDAEYLPAIAWAGPTRAFADRDEAGRFALAHTVLALRAVAVGYLKWVDDFPTDEVCRLVSESLGVRYERPADPAASLIPEQITDAQLAAIAGRLGVSFYDVRPVEIAP